MPKPPWSLLVKENIPISKETVDRYGKAIVKAIVDEARKDFAKQKKVPGKPEGLPDDKGFFNSFSYKVVNGDTVEIFCTWPYIEQITEGRKPYRMIWLTKARGVSTVPMFDHNGVVIFRSTPLKIGGAWIHPGFARHTFIQRGLKKGQDAMLQEIKDEAIAYLFTGNPLK